MLDIFEQDAFGVVSLTDAINKIPFIPGRAGQVVDWNESGVATVTIAIEEKHGLLTLLNPSERGGPGETTAKRKRKLRDLRIPHYQVDDAVYADEVQGVRAFGSETQLEMVQGKVNERQSEHTSYNIDPTLEYQRIGALKGVILNADGTELYDLFDEFGVSPLPSFSFDFSKSQATGAVMTTCTQIVRAVAVQLGGIPFMGVYGFAGSNFYDNLRSSKETRETFLNQQEAGMLRGVMAYSTFDFGGIRFEDYRGGVGDPEIDEGDPGAYESFIGPDECRFFPVGVPGLYRTVNAPADYIETVNTTGLPRYSKQFRMPDDKGINLQSQANSLSYCRRPRALLQGDIASD